MTVRTQARKTCPVCGVEVAASWLSRHVASGCRQAARRKHGPPDIPKPRPPRFWLDGSLRLRPLATLERDQHWRGVRTLHPRKSRRWERVTEGMM